VTAIADHINAKTKNPTVLVGYDTRFYSEEFSQLAVEILQQHKIKTLLCETFTPTPAVAYEIMRRKLDGAINFTPSHNPAQYHGLKFSSSDAGPALPEVTKDIEARAAKIIEREHPQPFAHAAPSHQGKDGLGEIVNLRETYLKRLEELVNFDVLRKAKAKFVVDVLHGCGAGYLRPRALPITASRCKRCAPIAIASLTARGRTSPKKISRRLRKAVTDSGAAAGLATDGDADRFGIIDRDGTWVSPNQILALVTIILLKRASGTCPPRAVSRPSQMIDAAAKVHGQTTYQTPVGFKYIGQLIREDKIALGGEESSGLTIRGHVPEKDGILACLLVAEMVASRSGFSLREQIQQLFKKIGREFWPVRENLHLSDEQKANAVKKVAVDASTLVGRKVVSIDRTDGAKFVFDDGTWMLLRLSARNRCFDCTLKRIVRRRRRAWLARLLSGY